MFLKFPDSGNFSGLTMFEIKSAEVSQFGKFAKHSLENRDATADLVTGVTKLETLSY